MRLQNQATPSLEKCVMYEENTEQNYVGGGAGSPPTTKKEECHQIRERYLTGHAFLEHQSHPFLPAPYLHPSYFYKAPPTSSADVRILPNKPFSATSHSKLYLMEISNSNRKCDRSLLTVSIEIAHNIA